MRSRFCKKAHGFAAESAQGDFRFEVRSKGMNGVTVGQQQVRTGREILTFPGLDQDASDVIGDAAAG